MTLAVALTLMILGAIAVAWLSSAHGNAQEEALVEQINLLLPQTQCGRCTFSGCRPYAQALARAQAAPNQCPPGGDRTAAKLAALLNRPAQPVDPRFGVHQDPPVVAWINEAACIGCTKCIQACPVDAIVGASRFMHTVIAAECTGCELCIPPCPVDCIELRPAATIRSQRASLAS
jgi:H+/Na+-translocating ferredoxin:NAD+ oxidoreductase subunit B